MKNKLLILIIVVLLLIVGCGNKSSDSNEDGSLLVILVNYNFKSGATYDGVAIFNDGTVYTRYLSTTKSDYNSSMGSYSVNTKDGIKKLYLEKGIKREEKVSGSDLAKIKEYIDNINSKDIDTNCSGDGKIYSNMYIYKRNEDIVFNISDCENNSSNNNVNELKSIINRYKK